MDDGELLGFRLGFADVLEKGRACAASPLPYKVLRGRLTGKSGDNAC